MSLNTLLINLSSIIKVNINFPKLTSKTQILKQKIGATFNKDTSY